MSLTIQILTNNNENTIEKCLSSIEKLGKIVIIDVGSTDSTIKICRDFGCVIVNQTAGNDYSRVRNKQLTDHWNMYLAPHEFLVEGGSDIQKIVRSDDQESFLFKVVQGTVISKEIRLWNKKLRFTNPVFEKITDPASLESNIIIYSEQHAINLDERLKLIEVWKKTSPTAIDPYYYHALALLLQGKFSEFVSLAEHYLFKDKSSQSAVMMRYYLAMTQAYQLSDYNEAVKNVLTCIGYRPKMAEFWCLLGDIHYSLKQYSSASTFYENAIILGSQRKQSDRWPLDVSKYQEHPRAMMQNIKELLADVKIYRELSK